MIVRIFKTGNELDQAAAEWVAENLINGGTAALPTGNTQVGMYRQLRQKQLDWNKIKIFMLDVNYPEDPNEPTSFYSFAVKNLPKKEFEILNSQTKEPEEECEEYEKKIKVAGGLDIAVLGIGENGHIAYNEPGTDPELFTHLTELSPETIAVNKLKIHHGLTMGIKTILSAKKILVLAKRANKAQAVKAGLTPPPRIDCPASWLQQHQGVTWMVDEGAGKVVDFLLVAR